MPALLMLLGALGLNYSRHRTGRSTICSTCRRYIGPRAMIAAWAVITGLFLPHYCRPFLRAVSRAAADVLDTFDTDRPTLNTEE